MLESTLSKKMTLHAKKSLKEADELARHYKSDLIRPEHLLFAIYLEKGSLGNNILAAIGLKKEAFLQALAQAAPSAPKNAAAVQPLKLSDDLKAVILRAYSLANTFNYPYVGTEHLAHALIKSPNENIRRIIDRSKIKNTLSDQTLFASISNKSFPNLSKMFNLPDITLSKKNTGDSTTPHLDQFCVNLNANASKNPEIIIGREKEIERIANILGRKNKNNPLLIGEPGVGKTAIVTGLAQRINSGDAVSSLLNKKILLLDLTLVVAGTSFRGEFEARLKEIIKEAAASRNVILFIDEIHTIVGAGNASGGLDAANILKPALSRGEIQCIGATTLTEYKKYIEKDPALERRLQPIKISEPSLEDAREIIEGVKESYENFHNTKISAAAVDYALSLSVRYIQDRFLPDKVLDVIDETASFVRNKNRNSDFSKELKKEELNLQNLCRKKSAAVAAEKYAAALKLREEEKNIAKKIAILKKKQAEAEKQNPVTITSFEIAQTVSRMANIPLEKLSLPKADKLKNLRNKLTAQIIGQPEALENLVNALYRTSSGIVNPDRPLGSFLFLGPTGVGKTLTAKILAQEFFEDPQALIRVDMSEFMERHNIAQLIGAPAGYIGYGEGGRLTEKVRRNPHCLILFDEIEKAHPDVFNILLQILEDGILTDAEGRQVNFKNALILLTSNMGTREFTASAKIGFAAKTAAPQMQERFTEIKNRVLAELKNQVKPEFLNRLDNIVVFNALGKKEIATIAKLELEKLKNRLREQNITLTYSPQLITLLAEKSLSFDQGARFARKNIQELVENEIARMLVEEKVKNQKISVTVAEGKIKLA